MVKQQQSSLAAAECSQRKLARASVNARWCMSFTWILLGPLGVSAATLLFPFLFGVALSDSTCSSKIDDFIIGQEQAIPALPNSSHMLFFLHIPRTAGRTYHSCFLKTATPPSRRCEKSYDVLRLNASIPGCGLLSSHDDMSISRLFPADTAYVTQLRYGTYLAAV